MTDRVDFSRGASTYDGRHGSVISLQAAADLARAASLGPGAKVLDLAAGTGRVAIPLSSLGVQVIALDLSRPMLDELLRKSLSATIARVVAIGEQLPLASHQFDAVVIARVLYLVPEWKTVLREVVRVLRPGGRLLHEWSNGESDEEWVQVRERIRVMFQDEGIATPFHPGVRSEVEVDTFLADIDMTPVATESFGGGALTTLADFLKRLVDGECSYTWGVPNDVVTRCLPALSAWAATRFDLTRQVAMPREIVWRVYRSNGISC